MTALQAMRWTLLGSIALCVSAFVIGSFRADLGLVIGIIGGIAVGCSALGCVVLQVAQMFGRGQHKSVEKPE